jgi:hypothetical protein
MGAVNPVGLEMLLSTMRRQLSSVVGVFVNSTATWLVASASWQQLGSMTQLQALSLNISRHKGSLLPTSAFKAFQWRDVACLGGLSQLQHLHLAADNACGRSLNSGLGFLSKLTALTELHLAMPAVHGFSTVSSCTQLRRLWVCPEPSMTPVEQGALSTQDCKAVSRLTQLTSLGLLWPLQDGAKTALYRALGNLPQLTMVAAAEWTPEVVPVFADLLLRLTTVQGAWREPGRQSGTDSLTDPSPANSTAASPASPDSSSCPQVQWLITSGSVPFEHFLNITACSLRGSIKPSTLASVSQHCTRLQILDCCDNTSSQYAAPGHFSWYSLPPEAPCADRVAALHGLARLPNRLNSCMWSVCDDAEIMALVNAARNVPHVRVNVPPDSAVTAAGLMQLGGLRKLDSLELALQGRAGSFTPAASRTLLGCFHHQVHVTLFLKTVEQVRVFGEAWDWLGQFQLNCPKISMRTAVPL